MDEHHLPLAENLVQQILHEAEATGDIEIYDSTLAALKLYRRLHILDIQKTLLHINPNQAIQKDQS